MGTKIWRIIIWRVSRVQSKIVILKTLQSASKKFRPSCLTSPLQSKCSYNDATVPTRVRTIIRVALAKKLEWILLRLIQSCKTTWRRSWGWKIRTIGSSTWTLAMLCTCFQWVWTSSICTWITLMSSLEMPCLRRSYCFRCLTFVLAQNFAFFRNSFQHRQKLASKEVSILKLTCQTPKDIGLKIAKCGMQWL